MKNILNNFWNFDLTGGANICFLQEEWLWSKKQWWILNPSKYFWIGNKWMREIPDTLNSRFTTSCAPRPAPQKQLTFNKLSKYWTILKVMYSGYLNTGCYETIMCGRVIFARRHLRQKRFSVYLIHILQSHWQLLMISLCYGVVSEL